MKEFCLQTLFKVFGISAASGLLYTDDLILLVSDNSNYLYEYHVTHNQLEKYLLKGGQKTEQVAKAEKMDLEAIVDKEEALYVFGSGSTPARELGFSISKGNKQVSTIHLGRLYEAMRSLAQIDRGDFNIEGVAQYKNTWLFLNRGNGPAGRNVIFTVQGNDLTKGFRLAFNEICLPQIDGRSFGFSDATIVADTLFFVATSEEGKSTYHDGKVGGTLFGAIDMATRQIHFTCMVSGSQKFEGITLYKTEAGKTSFLLCEDDDGSSDSTAIYLLDVAANSFR